MSPDESRSYSANGSDAVLAGLLDSCLARLEAGEALDAERLAAEHPELAGRLRAYLPLVAAGAQRAPDDATTLPDRLAVPPGLAVAGERFIGDYEVLGEIARGGMGVVLRARHRALGREVALKMLVAGAWAPPEHQRRFRVEAEAVASLDHPGIVPIYETGEHGGNSYFTMRLLEGGNLAERLRDFVDDPRRAARLTAEAARALHHAHQRGVLHRDLKPSNILLDGEGRPHVADFGLAKRTGAGTEQTLSGILLGTPAYMAPEQAEGHPGSVTMLSDVYGLGAILYALLTGKPPFEGDSLEQVLTQVREQPPVCPGRLNRRVDRDLAAICRKCLEKDPKQRYATAEALADDLERYLAGESVQARAYGGLQRIVLWCRRRERMRQAGLASIIVGTAMLVYASWGLVAFAHGLIIAQRPADAVLHIVRCITLFYIPFIALGCAAMRGRAWALAGGLLLALLGAALLAAHTTGFWLEDVGGWLDQKNRAVMLQTNGVFFVLAATLIFFYAVGLVAWWSNRRG